MINGFEKFCYQSAKIDKNPNHNTFVVLLFVDKLEKEWKRKVSPIVKLAKNRSFQQFLTR